jgi:signal transduction histidine kinase
MTPRAVSPPYRERVRQQLPRLLDAGLAIAVTAAGLAETWVPFESRQGAGSELASTLTILVCGVALGLRRVHPLGAGLVVLLVWPVVHLVQPPYVLFFGQFLPMAIAVFSMARYGAGRVPLYGAVAGAASLLYVDLFVPALQSPGEILFHWGVFTVVWWFGYGLRRLEHRARESTRRAVEAEVAAAEQAMAAVVEERTRIARELHDVIAHSVSMMVVQAGAAEQVVEDDPEFVRGALETIRTTGADALAEMRRVVQVLREADQPGALAPQPGLAGVPALVEDARSAGLEATLDVAGTARPLPAGVDLAAYRIVQEALTNVRRHAAATRVRVALDYGEDEVRIEVADDGVGAGDPGGGHGLVGMRERAALYGGSVSLASPGRGFVVRAALPARPAP